MEKRVLTADFIERLADRGYTKKDSAVILNDVIAIVYDAIEHGEEIRIMGFGSLSVKKAKAREYVNVHTGERARVESHNKISFKAGDALKRAAEKAP